MVVKQLKVHPSNTMLCSYKREMDTEQSATWTSTVEHGDGCSHHSLKTGERCMYGHYATLVSGNPDDHQVREAEMGKG